MMIIIKITVDSLYLEHPLLYLELLSISNKFIGPSRVRDRETPLYNDK